MKESASTTPMRWLNENLRDTKMFPLNYVRAVVQPKYHPGPFISRL